MELPWAKALGKWLFWSGSWKFGSKRQWQAPVDRTDFAKGGSMQWFQASSAEPRSVGKEGVGLTVQCRWENEKRR